MKKPQKRRADAVWYDEHYYTSHYSGRTQWYDMLMLDLKKRLKPSDRIIELGCGQSASLLACVKSGLIPETHVYGIDQSSAAIARLQKQLPEAHLHVGDIYSVPYKDGFFDVVTIMEVIEHVENPQEVFDEITRILKPNGNMYLSFPNFSVFPWNVARWFSDKFHTPQLINKQPIDNIYTIDDVIKMAQQAGFEYVSTTGVTYLTALLTPIESFGDYWITRALNKVGLSTHSLHPLLRFEKK